MDGGALVRVQALQEPWNKRDVSSQTPNWQGLGHRRGKEWFRRGDVCLHQLTCVHCPWEPVLPSTLVT